jgi:hypothetical protein
MGAGPQERTVDRAVAVTLVRLIPATIVTGLPTLFTLTPLSILGPTLGMAPASATGVSEQ